MTRVEEFKRELKALLEKYDTQIEAIVTDSYSGYIFYGFEFDLEEAFGNIITESETIRPDNIIII